ncbi:hypothetical protein J437_LFUL000464, partial [Ladona fulva]
MVDINIRSSTMLEIENGNLSVESGVMSTTGDPTIFGNLKPPQEAVEAVCASIQSMNFNGYAPSVGYQEAREAVAKYVSTPEAEVTAK